MRFEPLQLIALCTSTSLILKSEYSLLINGVSELLNNTLHPLSASFLYTLTSCTWSSLQKPLDVPLFARFIAVQVWVHMENPNIRECERIESMCHTEAEVLEYLRVI